MVRFDGFVAACHLALSPLALELFIALALWSRRLRWPAVVAGVALHTFIIITLGSSRLSFGIFALEMFVLYPLFFQDLESNYKTKLGVLEAGEEPHRIEHHLKLQNSVDADQILIGITTYL